MGESGVNESDANRSSQRLKGFLDHALLALIAKKPRYGFEMVERLEEKGLHPVGEGSIYPLLSRLQNSGLVEAFITSTDEGRRRKYYRILPAGEERLQIWNREWRAFVSSLNEVLEEEHSEELSEVVIEHQDKRSEGPGGEYR